MKTYFTADTHFGHARIIELCNRPFADVEEMNAAIIEGINQEVSSKDRLVILGDVCMGKLDLSLGCLAEIQAAEIILVPGNHDRWSPAYHHKGDAAAKREAFRLRYEAAREGIIALHSEDDGWDADGSFGTVAIQSWEFCQLSDEWQGHPLDEAMFSHFPYDGDSHGEDRYGDLRPERSEMPLIHGHIHGERKIAGNQYNVGVDVNEFKPVSEDVLADWVRSL